MHFCLASIHAHTVHIWLKYNTGRLANIMIIKLKLISAILQICGNNKLTIKMKSKITDILLHTYIIKLHTLLHTYLLRHMTV